MPIITHDKEVFARLWQETLLNAIAVKRIGGDLAEIESVQCGRLCEPPVPRGSVTTDAGLYDAVLRSGVPEVIVIGHGFMDHPSEVFVWRGAPNEFLETWQGD